MSKSSWSVGLAAVLAVGALGWSAAAQQPSSSATYASATGRNDLITYMAPGVGGRPAALTVIDPEARRIAVYHVSDAGEIQPKSVRNITWDLQMEYFNSGNPLPEEIRKGLERQQ